MNDAKRECEYAGSIGVRCVLADKVEQLLAENERLRAIAEAAQEYADEEGLSPRQHGVNLHAALASPAPPAERPAGSHASPRDETRGP